MAKKRKETEEEEEEPFKIPKFDKEKYIKEQKRNIKCYYVSIAFGLLIAIISAGFFIMLQGNDLRLPLVFLFGFLTGSWLKYLFIKLNFDTADFDKKNWIGNYAMYFFTWLVILIVLVNPPIYDDEPPRIEHIILPDYQELRGDVFIVARITDNAGIKEEDITLTINEEEISWDDIEFKDNILRYRFEPENLNESRTYEYTITAVDVNGLKTEKSGVFHFGPDAIELSYPTEDNLNVSGSTPIRIRVKADNVNRVYYTINDGLEINMTLDRNKGYWETEPDYWPEMNKGDNVTIRFYAKSIHYFAQARADQMKKDVDAERFENTIADENEYIFTAESRLGYDENRPKFSEPRPQIVDVPGFELIVLIASLFIAVLIFKKQRKK